ncbi:MAG: hypothetical protein Q9192_008608 [Flavoplaca navasiana]
MLDASDLSDLLWLAIQQNPLTFIVIDGLDECEKVSRKVVMDLLHRLQKPENSTVKSLISCRKEDRILRSFEGVLMVEMTASSLKDDIQLFVADSVSSRVQSGELRIRDPDLAKEITDELVNKAQGMFLWVFFQLDDLCEAPSDALVRQTLRNLPDGLIETYERIIVKIWRDKIKKDLVQKMFIWIRSARRPLTIEELREAAGFEPGQTSWDPDMLPNADLMIEA